MKKRTYYIIATFLGLMMTSAVILTACSKSAQHEKDPNISHYTCPMHPQIHEDHPGECPICHMKLVPVDKTQKEGAWLNVRKKLFHIVTIPPDRQQLIGLKTATASKKSAIKEILTVGRVAFDPDLAIAQREYLEISKNVPALKDAAHARLRLLGMSDGEIKELGRSGPARLPTNLYLPGPGDPVWIYATLYQEEMALVKEGMKARVSSPGLVGVGLVKAVDPVVNPMTRSARARIEVPAAGGKLKPDMYVDVALQIDLGEQLTVPKSAIIDTGTRQVAFVVMEDRHFEPRDIETGPEAGEDVVITEGIREGETVVSSAAFLVDSESRLKAAVSGPQAAPTCPDGEYWDVGMAMCMPKAGS